MTRWSSRNRTAARQRHSPRRSQGREGTDRGTGARKRVASDPGNNSGASSYGSSSSRDSNSVRGEHKRCNPKTVKNKRRQRSWRQSDPLERYRHYSMIGIRHPGNKDQGAKDPPADQDDPPAGQDEDHQGANDPPKDQDDTAEDRDEEGHDDREARDPRRDIQERLKRTANVIFGDTYANRPQRAKQAGAGPYRCVSGANTDNVYT